MGIATRRTESLVRLLDNEQRCGIRVQGSHTELSRRIRSSRPTEEAEVHRTLTDYRELSLNFMNFQKIFVFL